MTKVLWTATAFLLVQAAHSYILLTANIDDVQNIAKRLVDSAISGQVTNIVRRAYNVFNNQLVKVRAAMRAAVEDEGNDQGDDYKYQRRDRKPYRREARSDESERPAPGVNNKQENEEWLGKNEEPRKHHEEFEKTRPNQEFSTLGKSASVYLQKIQKIFEDTKV